MSGKVQINQIIGQEIEEELQQIRNNILNRLYTALNNLKGKSILADTINGFDIWEYYKNFDWNLFQTKSDNPIWKISLKNDFYSDEEAKEFSFRLDDIMNIEVDDNLDEYESIEDLDESYYCESIMITLWNESQLKLELQW